MSPEVFDPRRWCSRDSSTGTTKVRFCSGLVALFHPGRLSKPGSLESPAAGVARPMLFKVVSEEWCAAVDVARPLRIELRPGSMSQSDLGSGMVVLMPQSNQPVCGAVDVPI